jgi:hypothetical protein
MTMPIILIFNPVRGLPKVLGSKVSGSRVAPILLLICLFLLIAPHDISAVNELNSSIIEPKTINAVFILTQHLPNVDYTTKVRGVKIGGLGGCGVVRREFKRGLAPPLL